MCFSFWIVSRQRNSESGCESRERKVSVGSLSTGGFLFRYNNVNTTKYVTKTKCWNHELLLGLSSVRVCDVNGANETIPDSETTIFKRYKLWFVILRSNANVAKSLEFRRYILCIIWFNTNLCRMSAHAEHSVNNKLQSIYFTLLTVVVVVVVEWYTNA